MSARDLARFALLFLNGGRWNAPRLSRAAWVRESTTAYSRTDRNAHYAYLWWVRPSDETGPGRFHGDWLRRAGYCRYPVQAPHRRPSTSSPCEPSIFASIPKASEPGRFSTSCGKSVPLRPRADPDRAARSTRTAFVEQIFPTWGYHVPASEEHVNV